MKPVEQWEDPITIAAARTHDEKFKLYKPNNKPAAIAAGAVVRFKLCATPEDVTPILDIDSVAALAGKSIVTIVSRGTDDTVPAEVNVRFGQDDTESIEPGEYWGELGVVDSAETNPLNAFKRAGYGPITLKPSPGGDVGLT